MPLFLGFDAGTQSLKAQILDPDAGAVVARAAVAFGTDLPRYRSPNGYREHADPTVRRADPGLWLDALDLLLARLHADGAPLGRVAGISGSGQQHGSVYVGADFAPALARLDPSRTLAAQLVPTLSRADAPIWLDRSTGRECADLALRFGDRMRERTGSPAIERFTGPQIMKFAWEAPDAWARTATVHLVSSFFASILCGGTAPIDYGDGAGMNLLNLHTLAWDPEIVAYTAPGLAGKLPPVVPSDTVVGALSPYFERYGLRAGVPVVAWSGDNPNSLVGTGAGEPGVAAASFGTSDTFFGTMADFRTDPDGYGHVFGSPAGGFMSLICFTNGSLARERVKAELGVGWDFFEAAEALSEPGNGGRLMTPWFEPESTPRVLTPGVRANFDVCSASPAQRVRALLESQALAMRVHAGWMGAPPSRLRVTGGASGNAFLRRVWADVFQADVEAVDGTDAASLGAALRAAHAVTGAPWAALFARCCAPTQVIRPDPARAALYADAAARYAEFERRYL